jgi:hypothetical protein
VATSRYNTAKISEIPAVIATTLRCRQTISMIESFAGSLRDGEAAWLCAGRFSRVARLFEWL